VLEQLIARFVDGRGLRVALEFAGAWSFTGEVVARVEEFEKAANSIEVFVYQVDAAVLGRFN
jgi:hypothetical protein